MHGLRKRTRRFRRGNDCPEAVNLQRRGIEGDLKNLDSLFGTAAPDQNLKEV